MLIGYFVVDSQGNNTIGNHIHGSLQTEGSGRIVTPYIGFAVQDFSLHGVQY